MKHEPKHKDINLETGNGENFVLSDYFGMGLSIADRVDGFQEFHHVLTNNGAASYMRTIASPMDTTVKIKSDSGNMKNMLMFGSNNYLGLANHQSIKDAMIRSMNQMGAGVAGPPLLNGMTQIHKNLEEALAAWKKHEDAMLFSSGYQANLAWAQGLVRPGDVVLYDELSHASFFDGLALASSKGSIHAVRLKHNCLKDYEAKLQLAQTLVEKGGRIFLTFEGVYSMDGDVAPIVQITDLAKKYGAFTVLDDAHGAGVIGVNGAGTASAFGVSERIDISMGTFSKSFGLNGGFLSGNRKVIDYLRFFARPYMFSAHMPAPTAAGIYQGLQLLESEGHRVTTLRDNAKYLSQKLKNVGFQARSETAIIPILIHEQHDIRAYNRDLADHGLFVNAIEYPAVSKDQQRIRLSVMASHSRRQLDEAAGILCTIGKRRGIIA
ncbi:MAG: pyridoxal phosphate-dependent aminotransferase family protein [Pseudobacteriovorax sp.]|nr:pyridoxal phosphate-dependent aminotransferase family protein [Pseudobacteriovorax sp.]